MLNEDLTLQYLEKILKVATIECKTYSANTHIPKRAYQASAGYYLLAAKLVNMWYYCSRWND